MLLLLLERLFSLGRVAIPNAKVCSADLCVHTCVHKYDTIERRTGGSLGGRLVRTKYRPTQGVTQETGGVPSMERQNNKLSSSL